MTFKRSAIQVIDRLVQLLDCLAQMETPARLHLLSQETGLPPSTVHRILEALRVHGLVRRHDHRGYGLGPKLMQWGHRVGDVSDLRAVARPIMKHLRDQLGETVSLELREGDEVVCVEQVPSSHIMRVEQPVGHRTPLHRSAVGRLMLVEEGEGPSHEYLRRVGDWPSDATEAFADLWTSWSEARALGYARIHVDRSGVGNLGVLIREASGATVAGLAISYPAERFEDVWIEQVIGAAQQISQGLGAAQAV